MKRHTIRRLARHILWLTWLLALSGTLTTGCSVDDLLGEEEYESPRKRPTVPLKRAARWEDVRCFDTFSSFKRAMEKEGHSQKRDRKSWHHIVAQHAENKKNFGEHDLHCTDNVVYIEDDDHRKLNSFYSSPRTRWDSKSFRDWLRPMSFDEQYTYGIMALDELEVTYAFIR